MNLRIEFENRNAPVIARRDFATDMILECDMQADQSRNLKGRGFIRMRIDFPDIECAHPDFSALSVNN